MSQGNQDPLDAAMASDSVSEAASIATASSSSREAKKWIVKLPRPVRFMVCVFCGTSTFKPDRLIFLLAMSLTRVAVGDPIFSRVFNSSEDDLDEDDVGFQHWGYYDPPLPRGDVGNLSASIPGGNTCRDCALTIKRFFKHMRRADIEAKVKDCCDFLEAFKMRLVVTISDQLYMYSFGTTRLSRRTTSVLVNKEQGKRFVKKGKFIELSKFKKKQR